ncbi:MAG: hypothetical protein JWO03_833, partial [Bacteroidetes bacterium]|nr:hypothetical protein [Bacteroidota bacterium]
LTAGTQDNLSPGWWEKYEVVIPDKKAIYQKDIVSSTMRLKQTRNLATLYELEEKMRLEPDEEKMQQYLQHHKLLTEQKKEFAKATGLVVYKRR